MGYGTMIMRTRRRAKGREEGLRDAMSSGLRLVAGCSVFSGACIMDKAEPFKGPKIGQQPNLEVFSFVLNGPNDF